MRIYIAGAMTGLFNYREAFLEAEKYIKKLGHIVVNPAYLPEGLIDYYQINKAYYLLLASSSYCLWC